MAEDLMRYDLLAQDALRGVVRFALKKVERSGLPGEHHFYIAFDTTAPGVRLSDRLRKQYPKEMTIVLQHQYWGLDVQDEKFVVELSFDNIPEKLIVPFVTIKGFFDPSVQFGLQFEPSEANENTDLETQDTEPQEQAAQVLVGGSDVEDPGAAPEPDMEANDSGLQADNDKVVKLDAFRKK